MPTPVRGEITVVIADDDHRIGAAVAGLVPDYAQHRDWLRRHGSELMAWQFRDPAGD